MVASRFALAAGTRQDPPRIARGLPTGANLPMEETEVVVVGAGQAGIAMSEHLSKNAIPHIVLERARIAEKWRTGRWDSLKANGPAWHDRFPGVEFQGIDPDAFAAKDEVAAYLAEYAAGFDSPIRTGIDVQRVNKLNGDRGFRIETSAGVIKSDNVVAATGPFQRPVIPPLIPDGSGLKQLHSADYRNPEELPEGAVLVVGSGSSGSQIADELNRAGRQVYLSVGPHDRPPRSYRGLDYCWWLGVLGKWDKAALEPDLAHITISVSGAYGGRTVDFRRLAHEGITLVGMTGALTDGKLSFSADLAPNIAAGDAYYLAMLDEADAYAERNGLDLPPDPQARDIPEDPACLVKPITSLDLADAGITTIIWATGYRLDFSWLQVDTFDADGKPNHQRGVSAEPGVYFIGLPWLSRRASSFIWGVWHDARFLADHIATQRNYAAYQAAAQ